MDDKQYRKLMRWFSIGWFFLLALIIVLLYIVTHDNSAEMRKYVDEQIKQSSLKEPIELPEPIPGKDGTNGKDGVDGKDGKDGVTTVVEKQTVIHETITTPGQKGEKGEAGRELQIQLNPETGDLESKYTDDDFWQILIPCDRLLRGCEVHP